MARPTKPKFDESGIDDRVEELKGTLSKDIEGLPLELLARNLRELATLEAMMDGCKEVVRKDGLTRQETTGAKNNRHVKVVANANLDTYLKLLRAYNSVTASIVRLSKPAVAAAVEEEEGLDEFDAFNA